MQQQTKMPCCMLACQACNSPAKQTCLHPGSLTLMRISFAIHTWPHHHSCLLLSIGGALLQGTEIKQHMAGIPHNHEPAPIIHAYVDLNLQTLHSAGLISGPTPSQVCPQCS